MRSLGVALGEDLTREARTVPFSQFFCKLSGCGPEGGGVPRVSSRWAVSLRPAACPGLHLLVASGLQSSGHRHRFCNLGVRLHAVAPKIPGLE